MLEALRSYFESRGPAQLMRDLVDIVVVYYVFYRLLLVARGTRAMQVAAGLAIVALLYVVAQAVGLVTIVTLVGSLLQSIILVIVVVFQNDIRRALQRVGSRAFLGNLGRAQESEVIEEVVQAAGELARHRIGAIITFEQDANLDEFVGQNKGIELDAKVSSELLVSLFIPEGSNKLHDGSVIIRNLRVAKAGVFYPMPESRSFDPTFGSRHRAAIGITEETDAVVVVVSEERGTISFCFNGNIASNLQADQLREMLVSIMSPKVRKKSRQLSKVQPTKKRSSGASLATSPPDSQRRDEEDAPPSSLRKTPGSTPPPPLRKGTPAPQPAERRDTPSERTRTGERVDAGTNSQDRSSIREPADGSRRVDPGSGRPAATATALAIGASLLGAEGNRDTPVSGPGASPASEFPRHGSREGARHSQQDGVTTTGSDTEAGAESLDLADPEDPDSDRPL